jgi:radical SAM protein with 4Fe4S-binding SPASM domain
MDRLSALVTLAKTARQRGVDETLQGLLAIALRPAVATGKPRHLQVEIITLCNLGCIMCPRTAALARSTSVAEEEAWQRRMPYETFLGLLDQFPDLLTLSLHGIGEPLMHPHLFGMIAAAAQRGVKVRFTTNATLLDQGRCRRLIASGLSRLIVSLDGATSPTYEAVRPGAKLERVLENLRTLVTLRRESGTTQPRIEISMVVQAGNAAEAPDLVVLAHELGADGVILSPMQPPIPDLAALTCDPEAWRQVVEEARQTSRALGITLFVRGARPARPRRGPKPTHRCMQPWFSAVVTLNGEVMPCCNIHDPVFSLGNTSADSFASVWNGSRYRNFRQELRPKGNTPEPCQCCPDF